MQDKAVDLDIPGPFIRAAVVSSLPLWKQVQEAASQGDAQAGALTQAAAIVQWLGSELQALDVGARVEAVR